MDDVICKTKETFRGFLEFSFTNLGTWAKKHNTQIQCISDVLSMAFSFPGLKDEIRRFFSEGYFGRECH